MITAQRSRQFVGLKQFKQTRNVGNIKMRYYVFMQGVYPKLMGNVWSTSQQILFKQKKQRIQCESNSSKNRLSESTSRLDPGL